MLHQSGPMRVAPAVFGLMLVGFGVLLLWRPEILVYLIASMFIFGGSSVFIFALTARGMVQRNETQVFYRRIDGEDS